MPTMATLDRVLDCAPAAAALAALFVLLWLWSSRVRPAPRRRLPREDYERGLTNAYVGERLGVRARRRIKRLVR